MEYKNFYATFMTKQATKKHYVMIKAENEKLARDAVFAHFGDKFMTVYSEEAFLPQVDRFGLKYLVGIAVIDHGYGSIEYVCID